MAGDKLKCPACGAKVDVTDDRCGACGAMLDARQAVAVPSPEVATREGEVEPEGIEPEPPALGKPQGGPEWSSLMVTAARSGGVQMCLVFGAFIVAMLALMSWGLWAFAFVLVGLESLVVGLVLGVQRIGRRRQRGGKEGEADSEDAGADVNAANRGGRTLLHHAAREGHSEAAESLVAAGADVKARDEAARTPLHVAASWGHAKVARLLADAGADVNARDEDGWIPLHMAASWGHTEVTQLLLNVGGDVNARNEAGATPLRVAAKAGHAEVADLLRQRDGEEREVEPEQLELFTPAPGRASATVPRTPPPSRSVPQPSTAAVRRPVVVTIVAIVFGLPAIFPVGAALVALVTTVIVGPFLLGGVLHAAGGLLEAVAMVAMFGVLVLVCLGILKAANSLYYGADWARRVFMVLLGLLALGGVYLVLVAESKGLPALGIAFCVLFIAMLNGRGVREYCTR